MRRISLIITLLITTCTLVKAQDKYFTKTGKITFECTKSPLEKIEATNKSSTHILVCFPVFPVIGKRVCISPDRMK